MDEKHYLIKKFQAKIEEMESISEFIHGILDGKKDKKIINRILIVLDELFSNVVKYSESNECLIGVSATDGGDVSICMEYGGILFDVTKSQTPDVTLSAEERKIGGLGLFLSMSLSKSLEYNTSGEKNTIKITF